MRETTRQTAFISRADPVLVALAALSAALAAAAPEQLTRTLAFTAGALTGIAPVIALSAALGGAARASGADLLIGRAFVGRQHRAIAAAALAGALSPLCSCGVVPLIAGLLAAGVPLAPVMAFWLSSPVMDPAQFALTAGAIGLGFAAAKALAAVGIGVFGGLVTHTLLAGGGGAEALRHGRAAGGRAALAARAARPDPVWRFWQEPERAQAFLVSSVASAWTLLRWMTVAFALESLMLAWLPAESVARLLGGEAWLAIPLAALAGVPAYLNGTAAIPLVAGLVDLGMSPSVGLAFMVAGGVTSVPAAMAVWALVKPRVFALYVALAYAGAVLAGFAYAAWLAAL